MKGLKTQEGPKFIKFMEVVQECATALDCVFFLEAGDGREFITPDMEGEDLQGWLIPKSKSKAFESEWKNDNINDDEWEDNFVLAIWEKSNNVTVKFE